VEEDIYTNHLGGLAFPFKIALMGLNPKSPQIPPSTPLQVLYQIH